MKLYTWIVLLGAVSAVFIIAAAYTGNMGFDIDVHRGLAGTAVAFGLLHVGLISYQKYFRRKN